MIESSSGSGFTYRAFISYSHRDKAWGDWLHKALETYRVPSRLVGMQTAHGAIPRRLNPIFRDREELASATDLGRKVNEALAQSENLLVICSPASAASRWVNEEVLAYKRTGRGERIFCLIVDGEPNATDMPGREAEECFCPALRFQLDADGHPTNERTEPIAADARPGKDGKPNARLKLVAGMLDVGFDALKQREQQRRTRRMTAIAALALLVMAVTSVLAVYALISRNQAVAAEHKARIAQQHAVVAQQAAERRQKQAEDLVGFMLGDLHDKLNGVGRLDLMGSVVDKVLTLLAASKPGTLSDNDLTAQSRALVQVGQIRLDQAKYPAAMDAFQRAYQRSAELASRHPENGRFLFDRAQAEYWIGFVYWQQRNLTDADHLLTRYRDSTQALLKMDLHNHDWQLEATYGEHNLAVLALERGDLDAAQRGFQAEFAMQQRLAANEPEDVQLARDVADTISWLGTVAEVRGNLDEATRRFTEQARLFRDLSEKHPRDMQVLARYAASNQLLGESLAITGKRSIANKTLDESLAVFERLAERDPTNTEWMIMRSTAQMRMARLLVAEHKLRQADALARKAIDSISTIAGDSGQNPDTRILVLLSHGWRLRAHIALRDHDYSTAASAARNAFAEAGKATHSDQMEDRALADRANALLVMGMVQKAQSPEQTPAAWTEAHALLAERAPKSHYWRLLDPWLRLCRLTGDEGNARNALQRLQASGYVPLEPWPQARGPSTVATTKGESHVH